MLKIDLMRLSFVFPETNLGLLGNPQPPKVPLGFLGNRDSFADVFNLAQKKSVVPLDLTAPWDKAGMHFWEYYLENKTALSETPGDTAWKFLVPFRRKLPVKQITPPSLTASQTRTLVEAFYYPHGFACIITLSIDKSLALDDAVAVAVEVRRHPKLNIEWLAGTKEQLPLKALAAKCLSEIRLGAFGTATAAGPSPVEPFSILTVLKGSGSANDLTPYGRDPLHQAFEGLTSLSPGWKTAKLDAFDDKVRIPLRSAATPESTLYAGKRGRVVWFPDAFADGSTIRSSLSCYHRNLLLVSLQTESLCGLTAATAQQIDSVGWPALPVMHSDCARLAAGILGRLYGGDLTTYRSLSPRYQIDQNSLVAAIDKVRDKTNMGALK